MLKDEVTEVEFWNKLSQNYELAIRNSGRGFGFLAVFLAMIYLVLVLIVLNLFNHTPQNENLVNFASFGYILLFLSFSFLGIVLSSIWIGNAKAIKDEVATAKTGLMLYEIDKFCDLEYANSSAYVDYMVEFMGDDDAINRLAQICEFAEEIKNYKGKKITKEEREKIERNYFKFLGDKATLSDPRLIEDGKAVAPSCANSATGYVNLLFFIVCFVGCLVIFTPFGKILLGQS